MFLETVPEDEYAIPAPSDVSRVPVLGDDLPLLYFSAIESPSIEERENLVGMMTPHFWCAPAVAAHWARLSILSRSRGSPIISVVSGV